MRVIGFWAIAASLAAGPALAAEVSATSKIEAVTVFPTGAEIVRTLKVKLDAGDHAVLLNDLSGQAIATSIRVEGAANSKLEIGSVDARRMDLPSTDPAVAQSARKKIEGQIEKLRDQRDELDDIARVAEEQRVYLQGLEKLPQMKPGTNAPSPREDWNALYTVINARLMELAKSTREAKLKQREIDRQISELRKDLAATDGKALDRTELRIYVKAEAPLEATLKVRYQVASASWAAFYDARLVTGDKDKSSSRKLSVTRYASISQTTGEDWDDVSLALSTTRPGTSTAAPELNMMSVDFEGNAPYGAAQQSSAPAASPNAPAVIQERMEMQAGKEREYNDSSLDKAVGRKVLVATKAEVRVAASAFQAVYSVPGKGTIKTTGEAKRLQVMSEDIEPSLLVRTVPRLDHTAYLYAKFTLPKTSSPILAGQVSLLRDGVYVGAGQLPLLAPGEEMELGFGSDERVKVKRVVSEDKRGETGTFTTSRVEERGYSITVKNLHVYPVELQVIDRVPVPMHQDITVDFTMTKGPQPTAKDVDDRRGTMLWQMTAKPDEEVQLAFGYRVTAPNGKQIQYHEVSDEQLNQMFRFGAATKR